MKKYIGVIHFKNGSNQVITAKATSNLDFERKVALDIKEIYGNFEDIDHVEYEKINKYHFNKKEINYFVGDTMVGALLLENLIKEIEE